MDMESAPASRQADLAARYDVRVPRYTSYPTAPHFHAGIGEAEYRRWLSDLPFGEPVSLYVHVPFCRELCWYCGCNTQVANRSGTVSAYVDCLLREIELAAAAIGRRLPASALHLGGGTPNILPVADLHRMMDAVRDAFDFTADAEIAAELDPRGLDEAWIEAAVEAGLTRASLGVQDTDPVVQTAIRRVQPFEVTALAIERLRNAGVASVNVDLMYGLPHQSRETVERTIDQVATLRPDRIALFGYAHVPWMKPAQKLISDAALPGGAERHAQQRAAAERLGRAGYVRIGLDHFALPEDGLAQAAASGGLARNFQGYTTDRAATLIGFGASAIGRMPEGHVQNLPAVPEWRAAIAAGRLPVAKGIAFSADDRLRGDLIERLMCDFEADVSTLASRHGFAADRLDAELARLDGLVEEGLLERPGPRRLRVTGTGRPFVRAICAVFDRYLPRSEGRHSRAV